MNTQFVTLIVRLRLVGRSPEKPAGANLHGSLQQVGQQEVLYFDSTEKLGEAVEVMVTKLMRKEMNNGKSE